jgi:hypothetical protein
LPSYWTDYGVCSPRADAVTVEQPWPLGKATKAGELVQVGRADPLL